MHKPVKHKILHHVEKSSSEQGANKWGQIRFHLSSKVRAFEKKEGRKSEILVLSAETTPQPPHHNPPPSPPTTTTTEHTY